MYFNPDRDGVIIDDSVLIQKTNFVLHAAGIKASIVSLKQLIVSSPVIFVKVFEGIYGNYLRGINYSPQNREGHVNNMNVLVQSLQSRYHFHALSLVSGQLIVDGDYPSIVTIIDIFYGHISSSAKFEDAQMVPTPVIYETKRQDFVPGELRTIIDRVSYLRKKLDILEPKEIKKAIEPATNGKSAKLKKSMAGSTSAARGVWEPSRETLSRRHSGSGDLRRGSMEEEDAVPVDSRSEGVGSSRKVPPRPASASAHLLRKRIMTAQGGEAEPARASLTGRIAFGRCVRETPRKSEDADKAELTRRRGEGQGQVDTQYTYDATSGRRVLLGELEALQRRRQKLLESGVIGKTTLGAQHVLTAQERKDIEHKKTQAMLHAPAEPTTSQFPGHRTEKSVEVFNSKMKSFRDPAVVDPLAYLDRPVSFSAYHSMDPMDIIVSVEHCHNCEYHNTTLRHKPSEYIAQAEDMLDHLVGVLHAAQLCVRVGAVRIPSDITARSRATDDMSRIGALEVQIAFLGTKGPVHTELLHSKLKTRRWPGKSVVEKRMTSFLSKLDIRRFDPVSSQKEYPSLELCSWEDHSVGWVFNATDIASYLSPLVVDTEVRVSSVANRWGGVEKYSREGTVASVYRDKATGKDMARILFKYYREAIECPVSNCSPLSETDNCPVPSPPELCTASSPSSIPDCLRAVLCFSLNTKSAQWEMMEAEDVSLPNASGGTDYFLCRSSFYHQIHRLVWRCLAAYPGPDGCMMECTSAGSKAIDVQLAYSEHVLDWVFNKFGKVVNVNALMNSVRIDAVINEPHHNVGSSGQVKTDISTKVVTTPVVVTLSGDELEEQTKAQKQQAKSLILRSISGVVEVSNADQEDPVTMMKSSSSEVILSLRSRIQQLCLAISADDTDQSESGVVTGGDSITSSKYLRGAKKFFDAFDDDSVGELNMKQFNEALVKFGIAVSDKELQKLWASLDIDGNSHISLPELVSFLNFEMKVGYRELGEIWDTIRRAAGAPPLGHDSDDNVPSSSVLERMEKDMFSMCKVTEKGETVVSAETFCQILDKFEINSMLRVEDRKLLLVYFGTNSAKNEPVSGSILNSDNSDLSMADFLINFDHFFSWLQPVDFVKVCRRISRFLKAVSKQEGGLGESNSATVLLTGTHTIPSSSNSEEDVVVSWVEHDSLAMEKPTSIMIARTGGAEGKFEFEATRHSETRFSIRASRLDSSSGWSSPVLVNWEIFLVEENVAGIAISAIDPARTGRVDKGHFSTYMDKMGLTITPAELRSLYRNFGSEDGVSMSYENFDQLIRCTQVTHKFVPLIGSRMYRKKSVVEVPSMDRAAPAVEEAAGVEPTAVSTGLVPVLLDGVDCLELRMSVVEVDGEVLDRQDDPSFLVEIKYLLQELQVVVDKSSKQGVGKWFIEDLTWDPIRLTQSSLKMNADICVALRAVAGKKKLLGKASFSPNSLIDKAGYVYITVSLKCALSDIVTSGHTRTWRGYR